MIAELDTSRVVTCRKSVNFKDVRRNRCKSKLIGINYDNGSRNELMSVKECEGEQVRMMTYDERK
jgi:hypothetical protein